MTIIHTYTHRRGHNWRLLFPHLICGYKFWLLISWFNVICHLTNTSHVLVCYYNNQAGGKQTDTLLDYTIPIDSCKSRDIIVLPVCITLKIKSRLSDKATRWKKKHKNSLALVSCNAMIPLQCRPIFTNCHSWNKSYGVWEMTLCHYSKQIMICEFKYLTRCRPNVILYRVNIRIGH